MNPFLFDTVAKPVSGEAANWQTCSTTKNIAAAKSWPRALRVAGIAALTWANCASAVDLNSASLNQLLEVKGIGPKTAQIIIEERNRAGSFKSFTDLSDRVRGIGPKKAQTLQGSGLTIKPAQSAKQMQQAKNMANPNIAKPGKK